MDRSGSEPQSRPYLKIPGTPGDEAGGSGVAVFFVVRVFLEATKFQICWILLDATFVIKCINPMSRKINALGRGEMAARTGFEPLSKA